MRSPLIRSFSQLDSLDPGRSVVTLFSGGLDSSYLLLRLRRMGIREVHAVSVDIGEDESSTYKRQVAEALGATIITSLLIGRSNVTGGESAVYSDEGEHLLTVTLSEPGDLLLGDDRRTLHSVTPVQPLDPELAAHRDVLVIAYTAR
ncbi:2OG-Fe dioxygenase family protein [Streptomyces sp. NBC_00078]|uniref:2OG-Fe dioxygenase family protein n=1 Tax=unclassified Streptomyces TaxID=2593676 RepID=UPI002253F230|nr:2OG-Fe dioxygenase family protein [Streptomyces sp. NBC_00078]MCX5421490.1 2OG-Fe dioxygenase family protein [Streptomyces sp. NBC_00078]